MQIYPQFVWARFFTRHTQKNNKLRTRFAVTYAFPYPFSLQIAVAFPLCRNSQLSKKSLNSSMNLRVPSVAYFATLAGRMPHDGEWYNQITDFLEPSYLGNYLWLYTMHLLYDAGYKMVHFTSLNIRINNKIFQSIVHTVWSSKFFCLVQFLNLQLK